MLLSGWFFLPAVLQTAMAASECLVGCMLQGISPFDEDNEVVWDDREACDSTTIGCEVSAINYPSATFFVGALWASVSGVDGSSDCTCSMCDPYPGSSYASYMSEEVSLWSRIQCFIAASEESGYDMSPCVAAIVDTGTLPCVDEVYEEPLVGQFECDDNDFNDLSSSSSLEECSWAGVVRQAVEMFPAISTVSSSATSSSECLVGCMLQGISPFDEDNEVVWDDREACDSTTIGCEVSAINYPSATFFVGALWASTSGVDGSSDCTCSMCDPYPGSSYTTYMSEEVSLWSRIQCFIAASEESGYDMSPCVAAIVDTGTLLCVDEVYEEPLVGQFECDDNDFNDLSSSSSLEECSWAGVVRQAVEMFPAISTVSSSATSSSECLVGCMLQGISPFDEDNEVVWDDREACDSTTIGCEVSAINYPSATFFVGALWASTSGVDGSSDCTCSMCDPYPGSSYTTYMSEEVSLWSRIQCFIAASEESGYDMSPCVAAIVDTGTLPCVDEVYEEPLVGQFECDDNDFNDLSSSSSLEECSWAGDARQAVEMFPAISAVSSSATSSSECLVGCMLQGISPFDEDNEVVWDDREACDSTTIGCEVSAINYPSATFFVGALWASTSGVDGSSDCTCSMCDPYPGSSYTTYMSEEVSLWSRIQCFIAASEESGYDMSPCVAAIVDTGTLPCVDEVYEAPLVDQFECDDNDFNDISSSSYLEECSWAGDARQAAELFGGTTVVTSPTSPAPSALGMTPTPGPVPVPTTVATPIPVEAAATAPTLIPAADVPPGNPTIAPTTGGAVSDSGSSNGGSSPGPAPTPTPVSVATTAPTPAVDVTPGNPTIAPTAERAVPDNGSGSDGSGLPTLDPTPAPTTPASSQNSSLLSGTVAPTIPGDTSGGSSSLEVLEILAYLVGGIVVLVGGKKAFVKFDIKSKFVACKNIVHCDSITCECCPRGCCPRSTTVVSDVHDPNTRR